MTPPKRRQLRALTGVTLLVTVMTVTSASGALGDSIDAKRSEAADIQSRVDAQAERIAALDRKLDAAEAKAGEAAARVRQAEDERAESDRQLAQVTQRLATEAVEAYVQNTSASFLERFSAGDGDDLSIRSHYIKATAAGHREALEDLKAAREDLEAKRARVEAAQRSARSAVSALGDRREELAAGESSQRAYLAKVNGELARLVREEQARQSSLAFQRSVAEAVTRSRAPSRASRPVAAVGPSPASPGGIWACIRQLESSNNYRTGGGGAYQFKGGTWASLGGTGRPEDADPATQDAMAMRLQQRSGWGQWTTAGRCGAS